MEIITDEQKLRQISEPVLPVDDMPSLYALLLQEMREHLGGGIAAPQLGSLKRVIAMKLKRVY